MFVAGFETTKEEIEVTRQQAVRYFIELNDYHMTLADENPADAEMHIRNAGNAQAAAMDALYAPDEQFLPWYIALCADEPTEPTITVTHSLSIGEKIAAFISGLFGGFNWQTSLNMENA
jgi:hypothetical protein